MIALRCNAPDALSAAFVALQSQYLSLAPATASMSPGLISTIKFATPAALAARIPAVLLGAVFTALYLPTQLSNWHTSAGEGAVVQLQLQMAVVVVVVGVVDLLRYCERE
jgi:hypothetical protein